MHYFNPEDPIHVTVPGRPADPRSRVPDLPGIVVHCSPPLHPDDLSVVKGIPCTSLAMLDEVIDKFS